MEVVRGVRELVKQKKQTKKTNKSVQQTRGKGSSAVEGRYTTCRRWLA